MTGTPLPEAPVSEEVSTVAGPTGALPASVSPSEPSAVARPGARIEVATWRPLDVAEVDGWCAGFSGGFTRRANSVVAFGEPFDVGAAVERVEAWYREKGVPSRFRVGVEARPADLDAVLERRGYRVAATTHVLTKRLDARVLDLMTRGRPDARRLSQRSRDDGHPPQPGPAPPVGAFSVRDEPDDDWLDGWLAVKASGSVDRGAARAVVAGSPASYLTARDTGGVSGVIRIAHAGPWAGLSCLMVAPRARRRGLAGALTVEGLRLAVARGADRAFLQVEAENHPATVLYERLGFALADSYHYRELARP